jgi:hypothetical protein
MSSGRCSSRLGVAVIGVVVVVGKELEAEK